MKRFLAFCKQETVLCVALGLAVASMLMVPPDKEYWGYMDFRTLAILLCLMSVMAGFQKAGVFGGIARTLLGHVKSGGGLILTLVLLCFFSSMFITNDVALITFVPFTFTVLDMLGEAQKDRLALPVVVLQTIAANLGSMLTPVGNPQNLYLYGKAGLSVGAFLALMLPYTLLSLALLAVWSLLQGRKCPQTLAPSAPAGGRTASGTEAGASSGTEESAAEAGASSGAEELAAGAAGGKKTAYRIGVYCLLFLLCLLAVGRILPWQAVCLAVMTAVLLTDRQVLGRVDYSLLFTFAGFFVFVGNAGRIPALRDFLQNMIAEREVYTAVIASQVISNVPAALLLSGFTDDFAGLIVGTNLGGLGTLIASMASLISYKYVAKEMRGRKGKYIALFTAGNIFFLAALLLLHVLLGMR